MNSHRHADSSGLQVQEYVYAFLPSVSTVRIPGVRICEYTRVHREVYHSVLELAPLSRK